MTKNESFHEGCETCIYWQLTVKREDDGYQNEGICRRRAPLAIPSSVIREGGQNADGLIGILAAWPRTFGESDWCGDHVLLKSLGGRAQNDKSDP